MDRTLSPGTSASETPLRFSKTTQVQVIFRSVEETYPVGVDIHCAYIVSGSLEAGSRDWVGLYKVGWRSQSDYCYYDWAPLPSDYTKGKDFEGKIVFPAHKMPKDDGEFYQFCYMNSGGQVRGASTPFQFRQTSMDDLIEIEDENGELLVIKTKTALLEEKLKRATELKTSMKQQIQALENERNLLMATERQMQRKLQQQKEEEDSLREKLEDSYEMMNEQRLQLEHLQVCINSFQEKTEVLNQEKTTMEKRLDENDAYIVSLQEKIKSLVNEKDALTGRIRALEDEGEQLRGFVTDNERLKTRLMEEEICGARMKKEVKRMEEGIQEQQVRLEKQLQVSSADKETIEFLCERIRNAEDKLGAAEHCKMMLNEEVLTMKQAFEKMSSDLEAAKLATDSTRKSLALTQQSLSTEINHLNEERNSVQEKLDFVTKEKEELCKQATKLQELLDEKANRQKSEAEGSLYALEMAHVTLKERYMKMTKKFETNQKALENSLFQVQELVKNVEDQKSEVEQMKERLQMAEEAYKEKYIECEMLEHQMLKQQKLAAVLDDKESSEKDAVLVPSKSEISETSERSRQDLEYFKMALQRSRAKAENYRKLYVDQKRENEELMKKLAEGDFAIELIKEDCHKYNELPGTSDLPKVCDIPLDFQNQTLQKPLHDVPLRSVNSLETFDVVDGCGSNGMMPAPLRPLPAPMQPAKVKVLPVASGHDNSCTATGMSSIEADDGATETKDSNSNSQSAVANVDGERFEDAPGEPQRTCPICSCVFSYEIPESQVLGHIDTHYGPVCPICGKQFDENYPLKKFERHVNGHF